MSVYTRTGDKGKTSLYQGKRVSKGSLRIEAIGTVDELNSVIGVGLAQIKNQPYVKDKLKRVQSDLFEIGAALANPSSRMDFKIKVKEFEKEIDNLTVKLPELQNFILPGGSLAGSQLHFARTVARRAERRVVELSEKEKVTDGIVIYINRLSDLLFMYARFINYKQKKKENIWKSR
ncbi:MAG TPA: cob(I)yrinic acid a,c-diamide adenosyltransferase [Patescibacteria group bacterium]|nr:cob(I)yrinic acid a,c-diamide adenosyltransferase [Patescibacteria group bacterium]